VSKITSAVIDPNFDETEIPIARRVQYRFDSGAYNEVYGEADRVVVRSMGWESSLQIQPRVANEFWVSLREDD
jgi:hypothetical protein